MNQCDITLYGIIDPNRSMGRDLAALALAAIKGGATLLQYRDKKAGIRELIDRARTIKQATASSGVPLIINDRVDVALAVGADGVHLGQEDMHPADARAILEERAIIGQTIKSQSDARTAPADMLDYVCIGGVYKTLSKTNPVTLGLPGWKLIAEHFRQQHPLLPVGAIAGIDISNVDEVIVAGADGVAIISALFMVENVEQASAALRQKIHQTRSRN